MPFCYDIAVAGLCVRMETDFPLLESKEFRPFLIGKEPEVCAVFRETELLPPASGQLLHRELSSKTYRSDSNVLQRFFYEKPEDPICYAVATYELQLNRILIEYLGKYRHCVSELRNCFFHIGLESILLQHDRLCLHASFVQTDLGGILFSGASGIGKSTQAELWCRYRNARQINGDRPILSKEGDGWLAWGSPYAGSSKCYVNECYPIRVICLLEQAAECTLYRLTPAQAFRGIWAGLTVHSFESEFVEKASNLAIDLVGRVPIYRFACTPNEAAVAFLEQELRKETTQ